MDFLLQQREVIVPDAPDECGLTFWQSCAMSNRAPPRWPDGGAEETLGSPLLELHATLQGAYSAALYGATGRLPPPEQLRVVWLRLLSNSTLRALPLACSCASAPPAQPFFVPISHLHNPADGLWVHRRPGSAMAIPSGGWAEVTHCVDDWRPFWFYVAEGSALSINVGVTLVVTEEEDTGLHNNEMAGDGPASHVGKIQKLRDEGYDSVQFLRHTEAWSPEEKHELLMLRWPDHVNEHGMDVRCGRHPHLQPCTADHPAIQMQQQCTSQGLQDARVKDHVRLGRCDDGSSAAWQPGDACAAVPPPCSDLLDAAYCEKKARRGKCSIAGTAQMCLATCSLCDPPSPPPAPLSAASSQHPPPMPPPPQSPRPSPPPPSSSPWPSPPPPSLSQRPPPPPRPPSQSLLRRPPPPSPPRASPLPPPAPLTSPPPPLRLSAQPSPAWPPSPSPKLPQSATPSSSVKTSPGPPGPAAVALDLLIRRPGESATRALPDLAAGAMQRLIMGATLASLGACGLLWTLIAARCCCQSRRWGRSRLRRWDESLPSPVSGADRCGSDDGTVSDGAAFQLD